jgi:hypothetical protein
MSAFIAFKRHERDEANHVHSYYCQGGLAIMDYKILAIDFDGTISLGNWPEVGPANDRLISYLLDRKRYGDKLILWTCRAGEALVAAIDFCAQHGLHFDAVNDNLPEIVERYGSNSRKITCDYYIDDRSFTVESIYGTVDQDTA